MNTFRILSLGIFVGSIQCAVLLPGFTAWRLLQHGIQDPAALALLLFLSVAAFSPLSTNKWTDWLIRLTTTACVEYCPIQVIQEDEEALKPGTPYVMAYEPHSALPIGIPAVFSSNSEKMPKSLRGSLYGMASSVCFVVPFVRQLWWWLGLRPVSRALISQLLSSNKSVMLCPGGVQECLHMEPNLETVYLRKRLGFVRLALQHGAHLVPVFAFGQSKTFSWLRPPGVHWISRKFQAVPLLIWGTYGTPIPHRSPVTVVVGKPIEVPKILEPSREEVDQYLQKFVSEMSALFERHKAASGCQNMQLRVL